MTISELIEALENAKHEHGDVEVRFPTDAEAECEEHGDTAIAVSVASLLNENDVCAYVLICDSATIEALGG